MVIIYIVQQKKEILLLIIKNLEVGYVKNIIQKNVYLFIGLVPSRTSFYKSLQESGFILIFKQTITVAGVVKGNCDAELVLKTVSDFYTKSFNSCILITGVVILGAL